MEDSLIPMFLRLILTAVFFGLPSEKVLSVTGELPETEEYVFNSISDAQNIYYDIQNAACIVVRKVGQKLLAQEPILGEELRLQQKLLKSQEAWFRAIQDLERTKRLSTTEMLIAHTLKANYHALEVLFRCGPSTTQTDFDVYLPRFKLVLHHARFVMDSTIERSNPSVAANFTFENSLVLALYLTACRCRCPVTRREALALLERSPREGLWDPQQHAAVVKRIIELEEAEIDPLTGWPVERTRIWSTIVRGDIDSNGGFMAYFAIGQWGEGRGVPPMPPDMEVKGSPHAKMWGEWFVL